MLAITDKTEVGFFLENLSRSFRDLVSWEHWHVLEFTAPQALGWIEQSRITSFIKNAFPDNEGAILWTPDSVLCFLRITEGVNLAAFVQRLHKLDGVPHAALRMLCVQKEHVELLSLIERYRDGLAMSPAASYNSYGDLKIFVPGIDAFLKNWRVVQMRRKDRVRPLIMIVDDDRMLLALAAYILKPHYTVLTASTGREAIETHLSEAPDIIFLDIGLPHCNGLTVLHYMQQYDPDSRIIIFTADSYLKTQVNALAEGADGFVAKPFTREAFEPYLMRWTEDEAQKQRLIRES